ncbi:hypothetical protein E1A91_A03G179900v1 [Gossypium mustelinum]|uniref:Uncharacterized protein n=1 Tax=Gossypium mustelinum TaxID=34275 RepID=A0A5D2ZXE8_GOSMU|nr:hypothetical protein E1A91_A03G179900v1 [Gossypium mustelinum]TYJ43823.1 hypothetical protein E1A91_A03G179900v1 [Gossypium mustelinum]TYJ43824.1 hypothetical protein E1A91_A03G179900v1 [Gossypium mustelinum]TYJ43825.1 hypothetical protein E1A91_A03G179900v1 [Gossypium mustelinum]TYJ43826.1 hypothetical protein E1A91_A03G179900v1 [Gossypium mustelinum]
MSPAAFIQQIALPRKIFHLLAILTTPFLHHQQSQSGFLLHLPFGARSLWFSASPTRTLSEGMMVFFFFGATARTCDICNHSLMSKVD